MANLGKHRPQDPHEIGAGDTSQRISAVISDPLPGGALAENVEGRAITSPDDGFGKLWRKRYWIRLTGSDVTPAELIKTWKARYATFWPEGSRLYQSPDGLHQGDIAAIDLAVIGGIRISTGIAVTGESDTSFTFASLMGHTFCGTITFTATDDGGVTKAQVEVLTRASDPLYEIGLPLGGHRRESRFWEASLVALAKYFGVDEQPAMSEECLDRHRKWRNAGNIVHNASLHTAAYMLTRPVRRLLERVRSTSHPA